MTVTPGNLIQDAVDQASTGATVCVESGTYQEQVIITKDLTLKEVDNPTIKSPNATDRASFTITESGPSWEPIIFAYGGEENNGAVSGSETIDVARSGLTTDGAGTQPTARRAVGIFFRNVQNTRGITDNHVANMGVGEKETFGILAYGDSEVTIARNEVSQYERGGTGGNPGVRFQ